MSLEQATPNRSPTNHPSSKLHSSQAAITAHFLVAIDKLAKQIERSVPCEYFFVTFTVPKDLR
jgi:hypothetical protein